jgi:hypothetical protein
VKPYNILLVKNALLHSVCCVTNNSQIVVSIAVQKLTFMSSKQETKEKVKDLFTLKEYKQKGSNMQGGSHMTGTDCV